MNDTLAVVIPTRDTLDLTVRCVARLHEAGSLVSETVVVDDGGRDATAALLAERFPAVRVLRTARSEGFTRAANRGAAATTASLLLFLNSDTEIAPAAVRALLAAFAGDPRLGIAGAALHYPDGSPQWSSGPTPTLPWLFALASGLGAALHRLPGYGRLREPRRAGGDAAWVSGAAMTVRREVWNRLGPFDERFAFYAQDLDLCLRAGAAGWRVAVLAEVPVLHHHGATVRRDTRAGEPRFDPSLLFSDLTTWAGKRGGDAAARRARRTLHAGARLRLLARALAAPFQSRDRRAALAEDSARYRAALAARIE